MEVRIWVYTCDVWVDRQGGRLKHSRDSYQEDVCVHHRKESRAILYCEHLELLSQPTLSCIVGPGRCPKLYHVMLWAVDATDT